MSGFGPRTYLVGCALQGLLVRWQDSKISEVLAGAIEVADSLIWQMEHQNEKPEEPIAEPAEPA
jgi:hypothetical protein